MPYIREKIDSMKVTSWNPKTNDYATSNGTRDLSDNRIVHGAPRPYIRVEEEATGTTDIKFRDSIFRI
jgi:hypothetical protein